MSWLEILRLRAVRRKFLMNGAMIALHLALAIGLYLLAWPTKGLGTAALTGFAAFFLLITILQVVVPPMSIIRKVQRWPVTRRELSPIYWDAAQRAAERLNIDVPGLFEFDIPGAAALSWDFALARGIGVERALTSGSIGSQPVLEAIVAHECAHLKTSDTSWSLIAQNCAGLAFLFADFLAAFGAVRLVFFHGGLLEFVWIGCGFAVFLYRRLLYWRLWMRMLHLHEFSCDALAAEVIGSPSQAAAALLLLELRAENIRLMRRMAGLEAPEPEGRVFRTHPPVEERVAALLAKR